MAPSSRIRLATKDSPVGSTTSNVVRKYQVRTPVLLVEPTMADDRRLATVTEAELRHARLPRSCGGAGKT